jgi:uncharacterized RDD family membrane protein YckC
MIGNSSQGLPFFLLLFKNFAMEQTFYKESSYAGFWLRFIAVLIDGLILSVFSYALLFFFGVLGFGALAASGELDTASLESGETSPALIATIVGLYVGFMVLYTIAGWLYFALMESSIHQATFGKRAVGIVVTNMEGDRITFARATGRYFGKIISTMILYIGYIMAGFTEKKQALHDMMASTLVLKD